MKVTGKVLILGCGNVLLGDDGFGPAVAKRCTRFKLGRSILSIDIGTGLSSFLLEVTYGDLKPRGIVVVDAADLGRNPGSIYEVSLEDLEARSTDTFGLHDFPSASTFTELERTRGVKIRIIACQPARGMAVVKTGLSGEVQRAVPSAARLAVSTAREMLKRRPTS